MSILTELQPTECCMSWFLYLGFFKNGALEEKKNKRKKLSGIIFFFGDGEKL